MLSELLPTDNQMNEKEILTKMQLGNVYRQAQQNITNVSEFNVRFAVILLLFFFNSVDFLNCSNSNFVTIAKRHFRMQVTGKNILIKRFPLSLKLTEPKICTILIFFMCYFLQNSIVIISRILSICNHLQERRFLLKCHRIQARNSAIPWEFLAKTAVPRILAEFL